MKNIQVTIDIGPIGPLAVKGGNRSARWQLKNRPNRPAGSIKVKCVFNRYIFRTLLSNKIISTRINTNGNISYEGIFKDRKYRCDSLVSFFYLP